MGPHVQCLIVDHEERLGTRSVGIKIHAVTRQEEPIVIREVVEIRVSDVSDVRPGILLCLSWALDLLTGAPRP